MKNGDRPAHPAPWLEQDLGSVGLTKREEFAKAAMMGMNAGARIFTDEVAKEAVKQADMLLAALAEPHE